MSPETSDQEHQFLPSTPKLTPNLDDDPKLDTKIEDGKDLDDAQVRAIEDTRDRIADLHRILDERAAGGNTDTRPQWELEGKIDIEESAIEDLDKQRQKWLSKVEERYRDNEEAVKNQAINEARSRGVDINYPGYTDQASTTPESPDHQ